jgi:ATP-dependent Zn protease
MTLGGRVSEEIFFPVITTGAQDDLQKITKMAFEACANYGMNPDIGPISYGNRDQQGEGFQKPFSEATAQSLDRAVHNMVKDAHRRTTELLTKQGGCRQGCQIIVGQGGHYPRGHEESTRSKAIVSPLIYFDPILS